MWFSFLTYIQPMDFFDQAYISIQKHYKPKLKQRANTIALWYVSLLHIGILLLCGIFLFLFLNEMRTISLSSERARLFFTLLSIFLIVRNWLRYSGRQLKIRKAKTKTPTSKTEVKFWQLIVILISIYSVCFMMLSAV